MTERLQISWLRWTVLLTACGILAIGSAAVASASDTRMGGRLDEARRLEMHGNLAAANVIYLTVLADDTGEIAAVKGLAVNLALLGRYDEALPYQQEAVRMDPHDAQAWVELAFNYLNHQSEPSVGLQAMEQGATIDPSPRNRTFLAQALLLNGDESAAMSELAEVVTDYPDFEYARILMDRLRERTDPSFPELPAGLSDVGHLGAFGAQHLSRATRLLTACLA